MTVAVKVRRAAPRRPKPIEKPQPPPRSVVENPLGLVVLVEKPRQGHHYCRLPAGSVVSVTSWNSVNYIALTADGSVFHLLPGSVFQEPTEQELLQFSQGLKALVWDRGKHCTTGMDPEVFVLKADGTVLPAFTFLPSKKEVGQEPNAQDRNSLGEAVGYQLSMFWDGFQAEFAGQYGHSCHQGSIDAIQQGLDRIRRAAREVDPAARLTSRCVIETPLELLEQCSVEHTDLACQPSQNVYGESDHLLGLEPRQLPYRFAGFHVHLGINGRGLDHVRIVKALDAVVGVASVSLLRGLEDERRRRYYGLAGEYRLPPHGLEYRVLSSAVLAHPLLAMLMLDLARQVSYYAPIMGLAWEAEESEVRGIINHLDVDGAEAVLKRNEPVLAGLLNGLYEGYDIRRIRKAQAILQEGAAEHLPVGDMNESWKLDGGWKMHASGPNCSVNTITI